MKNRRIVLAVLIIIWMGMVFYFSNQSGSQSGGMSQTIVETIVNTLPFTKEIPEEEKQFVIESYNHVIRKLAHFSIYTVGGIILFCFVDTFQGKRKNKILATILTGATYAITDEIHQFFIKGRSCEIRDVCIDTVGVITGILIIIFIMRYLKRKRGSIYE